MFIFACFSAKSKGKVNEIKTDDTIVVMDTRNLKTSTSNLIVFSMEGAVHAYMSFGAFRETKISKQSALAVQQLYRDNQHQSTGMFRYALA